MARFAAVVGPVRLFCVSFLATLLVSAASAQITNVTDDTSTPIPGAGHDYIHLLSETVNPANGSVSLRIRLPMAKGRGMAVPFYVGYDSNSVSHLSSGSPGTLGWASNNAYLSQGGWQYSAPMASIGTLTQYIGNPQDLVPTYCWVFANFMFTDPTGGGHALNLGSAPAVGPSPTECHEYGKGYSNPNGDPVVVGFLPYSFGGTPAIDPAPTPLYVYTADGTVYYFSEVLVNGSLPSSIEDRNGNVVVVTDNNNATFTFTDTAGRVAVSSSGMGPSGTTNTLSVSGLSYGVTWKTVSPNFTVPYTQVDIQSGVGCQSPPTRNANITTVSQITLPNGGSYNFYYGSDNPHSGYANPYGLLSEIDYPDGGWVRYTWKLSDTNSELEAYSGMNDGLPWPDGCLYQYKTPVVATRQVGFGGTSPSLTQTFTYSTTWNTAPNDPAIWTQKNTTVCTTDDVRGSSVCTTPASVPANAFLTVYGYTPIGTSLNNIYATSSKYDPLLPLENTITNYNWGSTSSVAKTVTKTWYDPFELTSETTVINPLSSNPLSKLVKYTYGAFSEPVETDEYNYGTTTTPTRKTTNTYQSFPKTSANQTGFPNSIGLLYDKPCKTVVTDGNNNTVSETDFYYDGGTALCGAVPAPSVTGVSGLVSGTHDEANYGPSSSWARGNVTKMVRWSNGGTSPVTTYTYDETGQVLSKTAPCGQTGANCSDVATGSQATTYSYADSYSSGTPPGSTNAYVTKITDPLSHSTNFKYSYVDGQLTSATDANSQTTTYEYGIQPSGCNFLDKLDRLGEIDYPDTGKTTFCYNDAAYNQSTPSPSVTTTKVIASGVNEVRVAAFDGIGHQVESILSSDPDGSTTSVTAYDGTGKPYQSYNPTRCSTPTTNCGETTWGITTYTYDALGRATQVAEPDGSAISTSYSANTTTNPPGYLTTVTDEVGNQRNSQTDGLGRLTYVWEAPTTSGYNYETDYTYDTSSNLLSVTQKGGSATSSNWRTRSFVYDSLSRLTSAANPESGTTSYSYDANGNLAQKTSPKPSQSNSAVTTKLNFCYDNLNRETSKSYNAATCPATSPQATYTYDQGTNAIGHRTGMTDSPGSSSWTYDPMGRVASETRVTSNVTKTTSYLYNKDGSVQSITYPSTRAVSYTYGGAGRALSVIDSTGPINYVTSATYAPQGGLSAYANGFVSGGFTGITNADTYSSRLQPVLIFATSPTASIFSLCYDFHLKVTVSSPPCPTFNASTVGDNGNVYQIVNNRDGNRTQNFVYDPLNRIGQASTSGPNWGEVYSIDPWGNLTNIGPVAGKANSELLNVAPAGVNNQLPGFGYDAAGNLTSNGILGYTYDMESHLTKFVDNTSDIYLYDGDGQRVKKNASSVTLYWYGATGNVLDETGSTGTLVSEYIVFNGKRVARRDADNTVKFYFSDNLGSASVITNNQGAMPPLAESDYYPYGAEIVITSSDSNHYKFTGKERDSESGLDNFGARYYGSSMGRFMSPDWAARPTAVPYAVYGDPQSLNLYTYVRNNTLNRSDPDGHNSEFPAGCQTDDDKCVNRYAQEARRSETAQDENQPLASHIQGNPMKPHFGEIVGDRNGEVSCIAGHCDIWNGDGQGNGHWTPLPDDDPRAKEQLKEDAMDSITAAPAKKKYSLGQRATLCAVAVSVSNGPTAGTESHPPNQAATYSGGSVYGEGEYGSREINPEGLSFGEGVGGGAATLGAVASCVAGTYEVDP